MIEPTSASPAGARVLVAVLGAGPSVAEIVAHGPGPDEAVTHRAPRPFTLPQARNQMLNHGIDLRLDAVVLLTGALPQWPLAPRLWAVAASDPHIGCVTGLDLPAAGGAKAWLADQLAAEFGTEAVDVPAPAPDCMLVTMAAAREVGLFDANFARAGEVDWAVRARKAGFRVVVAPAVPLGGPATARPEGMVLFRHPSFAREQRSFLESGTVQRLQARAAAAVMRAAARDFGYTVEVTTLPRPMITPDTRVRVSVPPTPASAVDARFARLQAVLDVGSGTDGEADPAAALEAALGRRPDRVTVYDRGPVAERLAAAWGGAGGVAVDDRAVS